MLLSMVRNLMSGPGWRLTRPRNGRATRRPPRARLLLECLEDRNLLSPVPVVDVLGHLPAAEYNQFIPNVINFKGEGNFKDWGNEPAIAVNPLNPNQVVITTFAYSGFIISSPGLTQASVWYSTDGGADWTIRFPIPVSPVPDQGVPNDQTIAYDSNGTLHGAFLTFGLARGDTESNIFHGQTTDPSRDGINGRPPTVWQWNPNRVNVPQSSQDSADQPWIALQGKHVYVAYGRFPNGGRSVEVHVSASADGGATFTADNAISNNSQGLSTNPGVRLATDRVGNVYAIFGIGDVPLEFGSGEPAETHYRLNMSSDGGQSWKYTPSTIVGGLTIDDGLSLQAGASFGGVNRLGGNITSIAATSDGQHIYAVYGKEDRAGTDRLYLAEFHPDGNGNLVERPNPVPFSVPGQRSALPSVAVTDKGTIFVMYDTFTDTDGQFHVHLAASTNQGQSFQDETLYNFTAAGIPFPFSGDDRLLGDYQQLIALGNTVYGSFGGRGDVTNAVTGVDTTDKIVPFFFSATSVAPGSVGPSSIVDSSLAIGTGSISAALAPTASPPLPSTSAAVVSALFASLPGAPSASENLNANAQANAYASEVAIWQWLLAQQTLAASGSMDDSVTLGSPDGSPAPAPPDGPPWSDPFAALGQVF